MEVPFPENLSRRHSNIIIEIDGPYIGQVVQIFKGLEKAGSGQKFNIKYRFRGPIFIENGQ